MAYFYVIGEAMVEEIVENEERAAFKLHQRSIRDMSDPFSLPNRFFKSIFRFNKEVARIIIEMIGQHMQRGERNTAIPIYLKILASLHFYATGGYQLTTGQGHNFALSQWSMSRCVEEVTNVLNNELPPHWIKFPRTEIEKNEVKDGFMQNYTFPRCSGAIDCTHIAIISPPEDYPALPYYSRKGYYSINCQIIVDSNYKILNMNARFPGSTHDSAIWQASNIRHTMESLYIRGDDSLLIGDSGYPLQPFLLTPFDNPPENTPESNYKYFFIRARNIIEKLNGVLKSRFRCLLKHQVLNYDPIKAGKIIYICGVLHNISRFYNDDHPEDDILDGENDDNNIFLRLGDQNFHGRGEEVRNEIVQQYFNNIFQFLCDE